MTDHLVFPSVIPRLDIIEVAGMAIDPAAPEPVLVTLPFDADPNQTVVVQATDFTGVVPIEVVLVPDSNDRRVYCAEIVMPAKGAPAQVVVPVQIPVNNATRVGAWTGGATCSIPCTTDAECNDGAFCNGEETCDTETGTCRTSSNPCDPSCTCNESTNQCDCI